MKTYKEIPTWMVDQWMKVILQDESPGRKMMLLAAGPLKDEFPQISTVIQKN